MNWDNPSERLALIERVGPTEYNRLIQEHHKATTVATVNGYGIRTVGSRWGTIYMVDGLNKGHATLEGAKNLAREAPSK